MEKNLNQEQQGSLFEPKDQNTVQEYWIVNNYVVKRMTDKGVGVGVPNSSKLIWLPRNYVIIKTLQQEVKVDPNVQQEFNLKIQDIKQQLNDLKSQKEQEKDKEKIQALDDRINDLRDECSRLIVATPESKEAVKILYMLPAWLGKTHKILQPVNSDVDNAIKRMSKEAFLEYKKLMEEE